MKLAVNARKRIVVLCTLGRIDCPPKVSTFRWNVCKRYHNQRHYFTENNGKGSQTENTFLTGVISNPIKIRRWAGITGCAAAPKKRNEKNFDNTLQNHQDKSIYCSY